MQYFDGRIHCKYGKNTLYLRCIYGKIRYIYGVYTDIHSDLIQAVNMAYMIRSKYGCKSPAWFTMKYGENTARI